MNQCHKKPAAKRKIATVFCSSFLVFVLFFSILFLAVLAFTNGQDASIVIGQANFVSGSINRGGSVAANTLDSPFGLALDSSGNLWVADSNNRVLRYDAPFTDGEDASLVLGQTGFTSLIAGTTANTLQTPSGLRLDSSGNLWVADIDNHRVLRYDLPVVQAERGMAVDLAATYLRLHLALINSP